MTDINQTILEKSYGANRLKPDEQKKYLETFEERVLLQISFDQLELKAFFPAFQEAVKIYQDQFSKLYLKISPLVDQEKQVKLLKFAQDHQLDSTIVSNQCQHSPFALILHTDQAVEVESKDLEQVLPQFFQEKKEENKSFWQKLFH